MKIKFKILVALLICSASLSSQDFEIRATMVDGATVGIEMRVVSGTMPTTSDVLVDLVFGLKWDDGAGNDLGSVDNSNGYSIAKSGTESVNSGEEFQAFAFNGSPPFLFPEDWSTNTWIEIATVASNAGDFSGTIEIAEVGFDVTTDPNIGISFDGATIDDFTPTINGSAFFTVLPAVLGKFEVFKNNGGAHLIWGTITEVNVSHFEIEKSTDAANWSYVDEVKAVGNSSVNVPYEYKDINSTTQAQGTYYYRLKMIDIDGSFEYSEIRSIDFGEVIVNALSIHPNPASISSRINFDINHNFERVKIVDLSGKVISVIPLNQETFINIDFSKYGMSAGLYILTLENTAGKSEHAKLVVQ